MIKQIKALVILGTPMVQGENPSLQIVSWLPQACWGMHLPHTNNKTTESKQIKTSKTYPASKSILSFC